MKKTYKIFLILVIIFLLANTFNKVYASMIQHMESDGGGRSSSSATTINPNDYKPSDPTEDDAEEVVKKIGVILGAIRNISVVVSVIVLMLIGFKYIIGSAEEKANYKATMIPYIIGCVMAVAGTTVVSFIYNSVH